MNKYHLGINLGHDRSAAIVQDGEIKVAIQQERLDRCKHSIGYLHQSIGDDSKMQLPWEAINYCLEEVGIDIMELESITANMPGIDHAPAILKNSLPSPLADMVQTIPSHHLSHAYSAYWPSGMDEAVILAVDASGSTHSNRTESYSVYEAEATAIRLIHSEKAVSHLAQLSTLGFIYEYIAHKLGFATSISENLQVPEAGKLMGLASYGKPQKNWNKWLITRKGDYHIHIPAYDLFLEVEALTKLYDNGEGKAYLRPYLVDLACKVQDELEKALVHIVKLAVEETGINKLCLAGGVALNSVANYKLLQELELDDIFIFPAAGDSGIAAGNALWAYDKLERGNCRPMLRSASLGKSYSESEITKALGEVGSELSYECLSEKEMLMRCAGEMAKGHIVARFEGGAEYGPRALGNRSIMVDPVLNRMDDILNARVKFRESFRPFAPVVPEEITEEIFELKSHSPFMLLVADIKKKYRKIIPAVTHNDGTGRVQTVTEQDNPFFYQLAYALMDQREGPAVLLNTSFNVAGEPIVETPSDAIQTFLSTDIDYLSIDNYWIKKSKKNPKDYQQHLKDLPAPIAPTGLPLGAPDVSQLMHQLDGALFMKQYQGQPWSMDELKRLSAFGARFKETAVLTNNFPLGKNFRSALSEDVLVFLNPLGKSIIKSASDKFPASSFDYDEIRIISLCFNGEAEEIVSLRTELKMSYRDLQAKMQWANGLLKDLGLRAKHGNLEETEKDSKIAGRANQTLEPFQDASFHLYGALGRFYAILKKEGYNAKAICEKLGISDLQSIEPTYLPYYSFIKLGVKPLDSLIKLFMVRSSITLKQARSILGEECLTMLQELGVLYNRQNNIASSIDLFCVEGHYIATDHRFLFFEEDKMDEDPVMYIGSDSFGLINTAPQVISNHTLDLCTGSGVQSIIASQYSRKITAVDINPRAIRFARFNAQLNGVGEISIQQGDLFEGLGKHRFDTILANPPFVPSPEDQMKFRDGGTKGESILSRIVNKASHYLTENGRLAIVADLVDVDNYQEKLSKWWGSGPAKTLVLKTADRDEILFAVPHCHYPFNQSYQEYSDELIKWVNNFQKGKLKAVNFGYILIQNSETPFYYTKTISNPSIPIHHQVLDFFKQKELLDENDGNQIRLQVAKDIQVRRESNLMDGKKLYFLFAENNPFFTEYKISKEIYTNLLHIARNRPVYDEVRHNPFILDLIYKGILWLELNTVDNNPVTHPENADWAGFIDPDPSQDATVQSPAEEQTEGVVEFETKTTPTCLTSYLKQ